MEADWDARPGPAPDATDAPVLSIDGFEGPLDWLVEQARARRIDLKRLSVLALVKTFETALLEALDGQASAATIARWADWLVLAAELTLLRSRLMLPATADAANARDAAETLRRRLIGRAEMAAGASWLGRRTQLGIEVFERGAPETPRSVGRGRSGDITALLRACLVVLAVPENGATDFRVAVPFWSVADALARIRRMSEAMGQEEVGLENFLPGVPMNALERERQCRAALASSFVGGLELAREGVIQLKQLGGMGPISLRRGDRGFPQIADDRSL